MSVEDASLPARAMHWSTRILKWICFFGGTTDVDVDVCFGACCWMWRDEFLSDDFIERTARFSVEVELDAGLELVVEAADGA